MAGHVGCRWRRGDWSVTVPVLSAEIEAKALAGRTVPGHVRLELLPGEIVAVVGPSGCGKTTLLRILAGLDTDYSGQVFAAGAALRRPDPLRVGVMFQEPRLLPWLRVADNVTLGARDPIAARERALSLLAEVGLGGDADALPRTLSGGMAQRVALARAMFSEPAVLLLDEPFSAVDAIARARLRDLVAAVARRHGVAVLMVSRC